MVGFVGIIVLPILTNLLKRLVSPKYQAYLFLIESIDIIIFISLIDIIIFIMV